MAEMSRDEFSTAKKMGLLDILIPGIVTTRYPNTRDEYRAVAMSASVLSSRYRARGLLCMKSSAIEPVNK
jgi:hypothetical protein